MEEMTPTGRGGWGLMRSTLKAQWKGLAAGVFVGLIWTAGKVSVPYLVKLAIDRGIVDDADGALLKWSLIIAFAGLVSGIFTGARRYLAFKEARWTETHLRD